eukprot:3765121-Rhodomonas_salina.2
MDSAWADSCVHNTRVYVSVPADSGGEYHSTSLGSVLSWVATYTSSVPDSAQQTPSTIARSAMR